MKEILTVKSIDVIGTGRVRTLYVSGKVTYKKKFLFWKSEESKDILLTCDYHTPTRNIYSVTDVDTGEFQGDKFKPAIQRFIDFEMKGVF